jgi:hypothetical protein
MINIIAALEVASAAASKEDAGQLLADAKLLYGVVQQAEAKTLDIQAMSKDGKLASVIAAGARTTAVANALMADPATAAHIATLLESIG